MSFVNWVNYTEAFQRLCELRLSNNIKLIQIISSIVIKIYFISVIRLLLTKLPASRRYMYTPDDMEEALNATV